MSDKLSGGSSIAFKVLPQDNCQTSSNLLGLSDISPRDKTWDKHRANADIVSDYYAGGGEGCFNRYAQRVSSCAEWLEFRLVPEPSEGILKLKLSDARFCRVRHCPVCQWRRSLMWKAKAYKILPHVVDDYPKYRWLFITLTVKNCKIEELRTSLDWLTLPGLKTRGFLVHQLAVRRQDCSNRPRGQISPSVSSGMPYRTQC